ncbi:betaine-aldehyde dehydrogenase [Murinocardiopsis flavida]|uniref:Betaine-aldehyde dehydrogenase n=1 Tax=Murinocardiopsis flavida TaxID=645275 RepID=A0A2P8D548_9ACTN|nr:aldehyde dehydrogenase family protein [Murinocardiopsis flavida]PSK92346.1 betaine-aldehyde dehydrogenase [Murinocardiopsis flavida]
MATSPDRLPPRLGNFIEGASVAPRSGQWSAIVDPCTERPAFRSPLSRGEDVDAAMRAAAAAFGGWGSSPASERSALLHALADAIVAHAGELAALDSADTGKPVAALIEEEIVPAADQLRFLAGTARAMSGPAAGEYVASHTSVVRREPVGVCVQITPWNFPLMMAVWKIAPALAAGNTVVLKPAETTPRSALRLGEIAAELLPPGVLNVVCGDRETGRLLARHPAADLVALTGSTRAGREVAATSGAALKRLHLELGGNAAAVVFDDVDVPDTAARIAAAALLNAGQDCVAASRVLVHEGIHDDVVAELVRRAESYRPGPPGDPDSAFGPLNNADQLDHVRGLIAGLGPHAKILTGGRRFGDTGYFFAPTVVIGVRQEDAIVQEEVFGPIITVQPFRTSAEALALANGVSQGLACSVWTNDHTRALEFARDLHCGCVWINTHVVFAAEMPHGGFKGSGNGKDLSVFSLEEYTHVKHVMTRLR